MSKRYIAYKKSDDKIFKELCDFFEKKCPESKKIYEGYVWDDIICKYEYKGQEVTIRDDFEVGVLVIESDYDFVKLANEFYELKQSKRTDYN